MKISSMSVENHADDRFSVSAQVNGRHVFFEYSGTGCPHNVTGDAFVIAAIVPAMWAEENLYLDESVVVTEECLRNLHIYQTIYQQWHPQLKAIDIISEAPPVDSDKGSGTGCFFSGGVDSFYTVASRLHEIDALIVCLGLDIPPNEIDRWEKTHAHIQDLSREVNRSLITIKTNVKSELRLEEADNYGCILISTALPIGLEQLIVPSSHSYNELYPCGSHPLSDPLLSNGVTRVDHDTNVTRTEKTRLILDFGVGVDTLRVCNTYSDYNCGECEKCLRTMVALNLMNRSLKSLPDNPDYRKVRNLRIDDIRKVCFWEENLALAESVNNDEATNAIRAALRRFRLRKLLIQIDQDALGGILIEWKRRLFQRKRHNAPRIPNVLRNVPDDYRADLTGEPDR